MVFDTRGRRKHVVRVVYAILALLMGASLFLVVGPFNIANLLGGSSTTEAGKVLNEQAERIERKLHTEPDNEALLLSLTRARVAAGNSQTEVNPETGGTVFTVEGRQDLTRAAEAWSRYLKQADEPNPSAGQLMARAYFSLAEYHYTSGNIEEADANIEEAAAAQRIAAEAQPSLGSLTTLAIYEYFAGDFGAGDKVAKQAVAKAPKEEAKEVKKQMAEYRTRAKALEKQKAEFAKFEKSQRKEALENPFGGLGGSSSSLGQ
jgi:tetratricopeptide (TPR) repeat protein